MVGKVKPPRVVSSKLTVTVKKNLHAILKALELLGFESEGYKMAGNEEYHEVAIRLMGGDWMKFYKYKLAAWTSWALGQDLPPRPDGLPDSDRPDTVLGGRARMWLRHMKRTQHERFQQIISTMGTVKRAMERPGQKELEKAAREAFIALTREVDNGVLKSDFQGLKPHEEKNVLENAKEIQDMYPGASGLSRREFKAELRRTVREVYSGKRFTWMDTLEPFFPSTKSNYLNTRSEGGAVGAVMDSPAMEKLRALNAELITWKEVAPTKGWRNRRTEVDDSPLLEKWRQLYELLKHEAMTEEKYVKLIALPEALKVRVISKGPVYTYTVLKPLQKWMLRGLRHHKSGCFKLVGEEISAEYLEDQVGRLHEEEKFLSGDYKAATDNLDPEYSEEVVDAMAEFIEDREISTLLKESLTGHIIEDPDTGVGKPQTWGQLMGSVTSFPVLCIVNATICRLSRERSTGRKLRLQDARFAVNGDDCIFRANAAGRLMWEQLARESGMAPSLGKYFWAEEFLNMNSAQFMVKPSMDVLWKGETSRWLYLVPAINMGLLMGQGRTTSGKMEQVRVQSWGSLNSISKNAHTLISECAEQDRVRVFKGYLDQNWKYLAGKNQKVKGKGQAKDEEGKGTTLPWFLPEALGGLGLPTFPDHWVTRKDGTKHRPWMPTETDLRLAAVLWEHGKLPSKPAEGVTWKVWEYATKRMKSFPKRETIHADYELRSRDAVLEGEKVLRKDLSTDDDEIRVSTLHYEEDQEVGNFSTLGELSLMGKLCVEALFTLPFGQVYAEANEENKTLRRMEKLVTHFLHSPLMATTRPFTFGEYPRGKTKTMEKVMVKASARANAEAFPFSFFTEEGIESGASKSPDATMVTSNAEDTLMGVS